MIRRTATLGILLGFLLVAVVGNVAIDDFLFAPKSTGGFRNMMEPAEAARCDAHWQGLTKRAPIQAQPYEIIPRYTSHGMIESDTTYDKLGYRADQYEFATGVRSSRDWPFVAES